MSSVISKDYITTAEAALLLEITAGRVRQLVSGTNPKIESEEIGGRRFIKRTSVMAYAVWRAENKGKRKPRKPKSEAGA